MVLNDDRPQYSVRREQLLLVARRIFADRGFQATTMDEIAKEAGFTKPILYQYFESKGDLYRQIVAETAQKLLDSLAKAVASVDTPRAKIEVAFRVYFEMVISETDAFRVLFIHSHEGEMIHELRNLEIVLATFLEPFINISISDEHRRQLAAGVVGIAEASAVTWMEQQEAKGWPETAPNESERLAARSATLAWGGLRAVQQD